MPAPTEYFTPDASNSSSVPATSPARMVLAYLPLPHNTKVHPRGCPCVPPINDTYFTRTIFIVLRDVPAMSLYI